MDNAKNCDNKKVNVVIYVKSGIAEKNLRNYVKSNDNEKIKAQVKRGSVVLLKVL